MKADKMCSLVHGERSGNSKHLVSRIFKIYMYIENKKQETKSQIDFITNFMGSRNAVVHCGTYTNTVCGGSDRIAVICNLIIETEKFIRVKSELKLNTTDSRIIRIRKSSKYFKHFKNQM